MLYTRVSKRSGGIKGQTRIWNDDIVRYRGNLFADKKGRHARVIEKHPITYCVTVMFADKSFKTISAHYIEYIRIGDAQTDKYYALPE